jgi:hypothetical protein
MTNLRQQLVRSLAEEGGAVRAVRFADADLRVARAAAAEANSKAGYRSLAQHYLDGDGDGDIEVQSALIAVRLMRQAGSIDA